MFRLFCHSLNYLPPQKNKFSDNWLIYDRTGSKTGILSENKFGFLLIKHLALLAKEIEPIIKNLSRFVFGPNLVFGPILSLVRIVVESVWWG